MDNKKLFEEYALLKFEIKQREDKIEMLKEKLLGIAVNEGIPDTDIGHFTVRMFKKIEYSPAIISLEEELKEKKKIDVEKGLAKVVESPVLICK